MARAKSKPEKRPAVAEAPSRNGPAGEVLTLAEAAAYLRLPEDEVTRLVHQQGLPGRFTGAEWRFLKSAVQDWLRAPSPPKSGKEALLALAGAWKDDPDLEEIVREAHRRRGRPVTEGEQ